MRPFRVFQHTEMATECEQCGQRFDLVSGGVCEKCRRVLCVRHLHGSFARRLLVDFGVSAICVRCRAGIPATPES